MKSQNHEHDPLRVWTHNDFRLVLYYAGCMPHDNRTRLAYEFYDHDELIFEGDDFSPSPMYDCDGDESVAALLGFLAVRPGDTDDEYFKDYTPRQTDWAAARSEELSAVVYDLEEPCDTEEQS